MEVESITGCTLFYEESKTKDSKSGYPVCILRLSNSGGCCSYKIPAVMFLLSLLVTYGYVQQNFAMIETVSIGVCNLYNYIIVIIFIYTINFLSFVVDVINGDYSTCWNCFSILVYRRYRYIRSMKIHRFIILCGLILSKNLLLLLEKLVFN